MENKTSEVMNMLESKCVQIKCPSCGEMTEQEYMVVYDKCEMCDGCAQGVSDNAEYNALLDLDNIPMRH